MKKQLFVIFSAILFLSSCSWFNNDQIQPLPVVPQFNTFTISGKLGTNGAMPENFARALNSRTALATAPSGQTIQYKVLLLADDEDATPITGATSNVTEDHVTNELSYTIKYTGTDTTAVRYWLRAVAYYMNGSTEVDVLVSPDTQLETAVDLKGGVFTKDLEMRPATSGYGEVELDITLASASMCDSITISDDTHFEISGSGTSRKIIHKATSEVNPKVACGSYPVTVNFYKTQSVNSVDTDVLVYQFDDVINIFNNLTTKTWVDNGNSPHLTTNAGVTTCSITDAMLASFASTNFYVKKGWTGAKNGTFAEPFDSLAYAINYINTIGNSTTTYTIHIETSEFIEYVFQTVGISKKIQIEAYSTVPGKKDGKYTVYLNNSTNPMTINTDGELTLESDGVAMGSGFPTSVTHGLILSSGISNSNYLVGVYGKMVMYGGYISANRNESIVKIQNNVKAIFEMYGGSISTNANGAGVGFVGSNGILKVAKKPYIYGNSSSGNSKNVFLPLGKRIQVVGPLEEGALIGVSTQNPPTAVLPQQITTGYGYQTGGYNAGQLPGKYFRGDVYGVTEDGDPTSGEAVLKLSGGNISTKVRDDITIDIDKKIASKTNEAAKKFTFTVTKDKGAVAPATSTDLTSATGVTYSYILKDHTDEVVSTTYYTPNANTITLVGNIPTGTYRLNVTVAYGGNSYNASFDISYANVTVPSDYVATPAGYFSGAATLCASDNDRKSSLFVSGRRVSIPVLIASNHEVSQAEYERYCIYSSQGAPTTGKGKDDEGNYPAYWINWFDTIVYCNLCTMNDTTFGSTASERLNHCAYSLNGEKDPSKWNGIVEGTGVNVGKYCGPSGSGADYQLSNEITQAWGGGIVFDENADGWRLPTGVEWEYLARGGNLTDEGQFIFSGSNTSEEIGWRYSYPYTGAKCHNLQETKSEKIPNALGIYNMSGNLEEYVWDRSDSTETIGPTTPYAGPASLATPDCHRMSRGGAYDNLEDIMYNGRIRHDDPWSRWVDAGFRVVRTVQ